MKITVCEKRGKRVGKLAKGYIQVYTGNGKGKTTAALGLAIRAAGSGLRTYFVQFMKDYPYGEIQSATYLKQWIRMEQYGNDRFVLEKRLPDETDVEAARRALQQSRKIMVSGEYDLIVLDEICVAMFYGLLSSEDILCLMEQKPQAVELILTGRYCPPEIINKADLVTDMGEMKHYYQKGVHARKGIES